eukprot:TRINITY_DN55769_c0_g1_i1.p1 TRINITY_DN55769_c0_g1~~TRINITY_DN55769_c0_g1_i1.p1  ORF type:complete len:189 (-),score=24.89 TRINITY_DN55769_c0_g1_i1:70-636(-)
MPALRVALFAVLSVVALGSTCPKNVTACSSLDVAKYGGRWYEQIRSLVFPWDYDCYCTTATYTLDTSGKFVHVDNRCNKGGPAGNSSGAEGKAYQDPKAPCKLGVQFPGAPSRGPYWILETDYVTYSIVVSCLPADSNLHESDIWILGRQPQLPADLKASLIQKLEGWGFDWSDKKVTHQGSDCKYPQ